MRVTSNVQTVVSLPLLLLQWMNQKADYVFIESKCFLRKMITACWSSPFSVSTNSKLKFTLKPGYEDRSSMLFSILQSNCAISPNDFKHWFDKVPSGPSVVSFTEDCSSQDSLTISVQWCQIIESKRTKAKISKCSSHSHWVNPMQSQCSKSHFPSPKKEKSQIPFYPYTTLSLESSCFKITAYSCFRVL